MTVCRRWRALSPLYLPSGLAIFLAIGLPWHLLVARANPDFLWFYFVHEHFLRYATKISDRYQPPWYFVPILLAGMMPWTVFLPRALAVWRNDPCDDPQRRETIFLILWAGIVFAFFSASGSKLITYVLPCCPPLALLVGRTLAPAWEEGRPLRASSAALLAAGAALAALLVALPLVLVTRPEMVHTAALLGPELYAAAAALAVVGVALFAVVPTDRSRPAIVALAAGAGIALATLVAVAPTFDGERSVAGLAAALRPRLRPGDEVAAYRGYPQDLPVYLGRTITVAAYEDELAFGIHAEDTGAWMIDEAAFWKRWEGPRRMYAVMETEICEGLAREGRAMTQLARDDMHVLVANAAARAAAAPAPVTSGR